MEDFEEVLFFGLHRHTIGTRAVGVRRDVKAEVNVTPFDASFSRLGVCTMGLPYTESEFTFCWSVIMSRIFGRSDAMGVPLKNVIGDDGQYNVIFDWNKGLRFESGTG